MWFIDVTANQILIENRLPLSLKGMVRSSRNKVYDFWSKDKKERVKKRFLNKFKQEQNVEIDSPASSGGQSKYMKYVSFAWPTVEAAMSIFTLDFLLKRNLLRRN